MAEEQADNGDDDTMHNKFLPFFWNRNDVQENWRSRLLNPFLSWLTHATTGNKHTHRGVGHPSLVFKSKQSSSLFTIVASHRLAIAPMENSRRAATVGEPSLVDHRSSRPSTQEEPPQPHVRFLTLLELFTCCVVKLELISIVDDDVKCYERVGRFGKSKTLNKLLYKPSPDGPMGKTLVSPRGGQGFESRRVSIRGGHGLVFGSGFIDSAYYNGQRPGHPGEPVLNGNTL
ncbi:hypothetical protein LXL04_012629 [Taraxacum kok-saghyz]